MSSQIDLRLSEADLKDPKSIVEILNTWSETDLQSRTQRMMVWSEAINFYAGNQWIRFDERTHRYEPMVTTDANRIIDRPVTNHVLRWITASVSRFTNKPSIIVDPNSEEMKDKTSAKICEVIKDYLWEDLDKDTQYLEAALWGTICGPVFRKSIKKYTDRVMEVPGQDNVPVRCVDTDIIPPFQIAFDGLPARFRDIGTIMHTQIRRVDDVRRQFEIEGEGYFPAEAAELTEEQVTTTSMAYSEGLKNIVDGLGSYQLNSGSPGDIKYSVIFKEAYVRPTKKYPRGMMLCAAGSKLLYLGPSPYFYLDGKIWHPFTAWGWGVMPGSVWPMGLAPQLVKLQKRLNQIDALIAYNRKTMAIGRIFAPSGCGIPEGSFVGIPGQVTNYDETPLGGKPTLESGVPLPAQVLEERNMILADGDRLSLAGDIRAGENPQGVNTLGQLQILTEQADLSQAKTVESWEKFIERSETLDLLNFKDCYQAPDPSMVEGFKKFSKDITKEEWQTFTGNEIRDNASIRVEKGSTIQKSRILRQQMVMKMIEMGLIPEVMTDPKVNTEVMEEFGMSKFSKGSNVDVKMAEKAIEMMLAGSYPPVLPEIHNADIHIPVLLNYMKDPKYLELNPKIQILFKKRLEELVAALVQAGPVAPPVEDMNPPPPKPGGTSGAGADQEMFAEKGGGQNAF